VEVLGGYIAMTTLPNMGLTLPTRGPSGAGLWGDTDDANLALTDAHDHASGRGVRIKTAGISIDADLSFSSLYAPTALNRITFSSIAALSSNNKSLFVSNADNELYWRSNAGANVKLTSGSSLNVAAFTGGIGGDYTAVSASVQYDDANKRYTFKQGGGTTWARLQSGPLRLVELGTSETVFVEQAAPSALAASYTVTWPLALPGSSVFVKIDNTGQLAFTAVTTSLVYQHSAALAILGDATATLLTNGSTVGPELSLHASTAEHVLPLTLPVGTITAFAVNLNKSSAAGTISVKLFESNNLSTPTQIGSTQSNGASNPGAVTLSQSGLSAAMTSGRQYYIVITGGGTNGDNVTAYSATVTT
jgi:hypothetical protein